MRVRILGTLTLVLLLAAVPVTSSAASITLFADLDGAQEVPSVTTNGVGSAAMIYDTVSGVLQWAILFSDLTSNGILAHFHSAPAGQIGGVVLDIGANTTGGALFATSGMITGSATVNPADVADLLNERWYINIHTINNGGGELRGVVQNTTTQGVPEPATSALLLLGLAGLSYAGRARA